MKIVAGERNDGRKPFDFDVTDKKTGEKFKFSKTGISRLEAWTELEKQKGNSWEIKWA
jgi:hypothetical protein